MCNKDDGAVFSLSFFQDDAPIAFRVLEDMISKAQETKGSVPPATDDAR
jgi:hypothetical protein